MKTSKLTRLAMFLALGLVLSYLENLIPLNFSIPGVKVGLANMVTMFVLYCYGTKDSALILILRVLLSGFLFSGLSTILFGIVGGFFCILSMHFVKKSNYFSVMGVSMTGAVFHNIGQIIAAFIVMQNTNILYYIPYLCLTGLVSGLLIGYISAFLVKRFQNI